jgi:hypothetical protein
MKQGFFGIRRIITAEGADRVQGVKIGSKVRWANSQNYPIIFL